MEQSTLILNLFVCRPERAAGSNYVIQYVLALGAVKVMEKDLIRTRHQIEKFYKLKSQLQGVSLRIQNLSWEKMTSKDKYYILCTRYGKSYTMEELDELDEVRMETIKFIEDKLE